MDRETLRRLEMLNQLSLTEAQKDDVISFFEKREEQKIVSLPASAAGASFLIRAHRIILPRGASDGGRG